MTSDDRLHLLGIGHVVVRARVPVVVTLLLVVLLAHRGSDCGTSERST